MLDGSQIGITMFLGDVRISLSDASLATGCRQTEILSAAAGSQVSTTLLGDRFYRALPKMISNPEALQHRLRAIKPEAMQGWTEMHRGPEATGFLIAAWSPANHNDTLIMVRAWRNDARGVVPYMVSWQYSTMLTSDLDDALNYSHTKHKSIALDHETIKVARKVALVGIAAIVAKADLSIVAQMDHAAGIDYTAGARYGIVA